ncbi:hypothetical protein ACFQ0X_43130 [Streptomyces rectiviolaceus]|uniref:hypothetical protein n=1 Tax=Streptomyces rectiviolaceus TaxID=332591 RepID=UPI003631430C
MAEIWGEEQLIADGFERVHAESEWYGEPWAGLADIDGKPHYFEMHVYDHSHEVDEYQVWPASEAVAELEREQWAIYARWYERREAGRLDRRAIRATAGSTPAMTSWSCCWRRTAWRRTAPVGSCVSCGSLPVSTFATESRGPTTGFGGIRGRR